MFRPATRRLAVLASRNASLAPRSINRVTARRAYSEAHHAYEKSSDLPWYESPLLFNAIAFAILINPKTMLTYYLIRLVAAVAVTVPGV